MNIQTATTEYESWLESHTAVVEEDLAIKHQHMKKDLFLFLRATYYRWAQLWPEICQELAEAPEVLAVGDLHIENFGTWRDSEGRLVWGCNDFDEAWTLSYTNDLVRVAASAAFAIKMDHLHIGFKDACKNVLKGYRDGLKAGGRPFILAEQHSALRKMATADLRDPVHFWTVKAAKLPLFTGDLPPAAAELIAEMLPQADLPGRVCTRVAGNGSLGHQRYVRIADWQGGQIARETKAMVPSSVTWAAGIETDEILSEKIIDQAVRCADPFVKVSKGWVVRRLAPDCSAIAVTDWPDKRNEKRLMYSMGWETANVHLGSPDNTAAILQDLDNRDPSWLPRAAKNMMKVTRKDWKEWRKSAKQKG